MSDTIAAPRPWTRYWAHSDTHRVGRRESAHVVDVQRFARLVHAFGGYTVDPHPSNPMQSAPYVMFGAYQIEHPAPYILTTYCEGDVSVEHYATAAHRDRALWLLVRAL